MKRDKPSKKQVKLQSIRAVFEETPLHTLTISIRPRIINIASAFGISRETLKDFLKGQGYENLRDTTLLAEEDLAIIEKQFARDKNAKDEVKGKSIIKFRTSSASYQTLEDENPIGTENNGYRHRALHLKDNLFDKVKQVIRLQSYSAISSPFTDTEAINICSKMSSSYARNLCKQSNNANDNKALVIYQIHFIANKALKIFGGQMLTFLYQLRNLQFKNRTAQEVQTYERVIPDFPIISFVSEKASFKIAFFVKRGRSKNELRPDIRMFTRGTHQEIGNIDEHGYVMTKLEKFKPHLNLFFEASSEGALKIFSGVETGKCDLCPNTLTHPLSLRIGIGPVCAKNHNIDRTLYCYD